MCFLNQIPSAIVLTLFLIFSNFETQAQNITSTWLGITGTYIEAGEDALLMDPVVTRPSMFDLVRFKKIFPDEKMAKSWIKRLNPKKVHGIFISHSHFDHALDCGVFARLTGATLFGTETTLNIGRGSKVPEAQLKRMELEKPIQLGRFTVTPVHANHSPIALGYIPFQGQLTKPLKLPAAPSDYLLGKSYNYFIEHPAGNIYFKPSSAITERELKFLEGKNFKTMYLGIAGSLMDIDLIKQKILKGRSVTKVIPMHFDNFFNQVKDDKVSDLFVLDFNKIKAKFVKDSKGFKYLRPNIGEKINLF